MRILRRFIPDTHDVPSVVMAELSLVLFLAGFLTQQSWLGWSGVAVFAVAAVYHVVRYATNPHLTRELETT